MTSYILKLTLTFLSSHFPRWSKMSRQKLKKVNNEKAFLNDKKYFLKAISFWIGNERKFDYWYEVPVDMTNFMTKR